MSRKTGAVSREIRDIQSQIRQEEGRDLKTKIEKLKLDLQMLQNENSEMLKTLKGKHNGVAASFFPAQVSSAHLARDVEFSIFAEEESLV